MADPFLQTHYNKRICWLERDRNHWLLSTDDRTLTLAARRLVLSGNLLAHPRGKSLLGWDAIPLRSAVPKGFDPQLDDVLSCVSASSASIRWTCMIQLSDTQRPEITTNWPGQIWLMKGSEPLAVERLYCSLNRTVELAGDPWLTGIGTMHHPGKFPRRSTRKDVS